MRNSQVLLPAFLALAFAAPAPAQSVDYEKYTLDNGLTVILHEDHRLPVVQINTWYYVGAKDEPAGRSGFAHLFEHLMFMGTERVPGSQFDQLMEAGGGANNASTDFDRTNYYSWGPAELLPTLLWLDADRLEDLGRMMTQEKLDLQRDVVRNERRQTTENVPYGRSEVKKTALLFPEGHPYHDGVIGSHADLEAAVVDDVKEFFSNFYVPNNASLVVAGDFDPSRIKPMIAEQFGTIPRGAAVVQDPAALPALDGERRCTMLDRVQLPLVRLAAVSPSIYQEGDAEMRVIAELLGKEKSGRLYRRLVMEEELAVEVSASQESLILGSIFSVDVLARPGADLDRIEEIVDEETERLWREGPTGEELSQVQIGIERRMLSGLESLRRKADRLNQYQFHLGEPDSFAWDLDRFRKLTPAALREWRVLPPENRVVVRVLPEEPQRAPSARDERPADLPDRSFRPIAPERFELANGIGVTLWTRSDLPLVELSLLVEAPEGRVLDSADGAGSGALLAQMLSEGAGERDALEFAAALENLGARLRARPDHRGLVISLSALRRNLEPALELFADAALRPRFDETDWRRVKDLHLEDVKQQVDRASLVAGQAANRVFFGADHPFGRPLSGTVATVGGIEREDVAALHRGLFVPGRAQLVIAGDLDAADARRFLEAGFGDWKAGAREVGSVARWDVPDRDELAICVVDRPGAVQTVIRFQLPGIVRTDPRRVPYQMIGTALGGTFTSRLNANLREDKGFTYGARSSYAMDTECGWFVASSSVRTDVTGAALAEFLKEFEGLRRGDLTATELEKARGAIRQDTIESFGSLSGMTRQGIELLSMHLPFETIAEELARLDQVALEEANGLARKAIPLERGVLVLVGDAARIREQVEALGLPRPIELTAEGVLVR